MANNNKLEYIIDRI